MKLFGVRLLGFTTENLHKLLLTVGFVAAILLTRAAALYLLRIVGRRHGNERLMFWSRQGSAVLATLLALLAVVSIWFDDPGKMALPFGLVTAGLAFALQKVITSFAGYVIILRGKTFSVGDRIAMGGVRGDVIRLGFFQTTIMEMGQPRSVQSAEPPVWVHARQYTGRIVTVTNDKVFDEPVFNYNREYPFLWEEIVIPVKYGDDRARAEEILLRCADRATREIRSVTDADRAAMSERYAVDLSELDPRVFVRLTDNWVELTVRFVARPHGVRGLKDGISRAILSELEHANIGLASATFEIVGVPPLQLEASPKRRAGGERIGARPSLPSAS